MAFHQEKIRKYLAKAIPNQPRKSLLTILKVPDLPPFVMSTRRNDDDKNIAISESVVHVSMTSTVPRAHTLKKRKRAISASENDGLMSEQSAGRISPVDLASDKEAPQIVELPKETVCPLDSLPSRSEAEEAKIDLYEQRVFLPRLNRILKAAGKRHTSGKCRNWPTVRSKLKEAGVTVKWRNSFGYDFNRGYEVWDVNADIDPNEMLAHFAAAFRSQVDQKLKQMSPLMVEVIISPSSVRQRASEPVKEPGTPSLGGMITKEEENGGRHEQTERQSVTDLEDEMPTVSVPR